MAQTLEQLARQEQTLTSIRGIVRTMKVLAAINAAPYEHAARSIEDYHRTISNGFSALAYRLRRQVLVDTEPARRRALVAFGSDHGFCGNYNELVAARIRAFSARAGTSFGVILCVGARLHAALEEGGMHVDQVLVPPASADGVGRLAGDILTRIEHMSRGHALTELAIDLAYTRRAEHGSRTPVITGLLPLAPSLLQVPARWPSRALPSFSMAPEALLLALVRNHVFASVFRAAAEAMVTENGARLALMQQAEHSVDEHLEAVRRQVSSVRQDQVTAELMDIVIGHAG